MKCSAILRALGLIASFPDPTCNVCDHHLRELWALALSRFTLAYLFRSLITLPPPLSPSLPLPQSLPMGVLENELLDDTKKTTFIKSRRLRCLLLFR